MESTLSMGYIMHSLNGHMNAYMYIYIKAIMNLIWSDCE